MLKQKSSRLIKSTLAAPGELGFIMAEELSERWQEELEAPRMNHQKSNKSPDPSASELLLSSLDWIEAISLKGPAALAKRRKYIGLIH